MPSRSRNRQIAPQLIGFRKEYSPGLTAQEKLNIKTRRRQYQAANGPGNNFRRKFQGTCGHCGKYGHRTTECRSNPANRNQMNQAGQVTSTYCGNFGHQAHACWSNNANRNQNQIGFAMPSRSRNRQIAPQLIDFQAPPLDLWSDSITPTMGSSVLPEASHVKQKRRATQGISLTDTPGPPQESTALSKAKLIQKATPQAGDEWVPKLKRAKKTARKTTAGKAPRLQSNCSTNNDSESSRKQVSRSLSEQLNSVPSEVSSSPDNQIDWMVPPPDPTPPHPDSYETTDDEVYQEYLSKLVEIGAHYDLLGLYGRLLQSPSQTERDPFLL